MKVVGQYMSIERFGIHIAKKGYSAVDVSTARVMTYDGKSVEECEKCYVIINSGYYVFEIKTIEDEYLSPKVANSLVKDIAIKDVVDLDLYDMALFDMRDVRPEWIDVSNERDEEYNPIPLEVYVVNK